MVKNGERDVSKELAFDDWEIYGDMRRNAKAARYHLERSRRVEGDDRQKAERMALWQAGMVDRGCAKALEPGHFLLLWPPGVSTETRYNLQAAIRMVHTSLPFTLEERRRLAEPVEAYLEVHPAADLHGLLDLPVDEPELIARWHDWLHTDEFGMTQHTTKAVGPRAILEEGYRALAAHLDYILEDPMSEPI